MTSVTDPPPFDPPPMRDRVVQVSGGAEGIGRVSRRRRQAVTVKITERELRVAELIRSKLVKAGMFLVGIDIIGDTILEVNVFSPGNLNSCSEMAGVNFATVILKSIERKVEIAAEFPGHFDNKSLAVM